MEGFIVDPRKSGPEEFERGMRDVKLVFAINHTMPYTEEYDKLVNQDTRTSRPQRQGFMMTV